VVDALDAFFRHGESDLDPDGFLAVLSGWTRSALTALSPGACLLAEYIACLEDSDRRVGIIEANWAGLWQRLGRPGEPPEPGPVLGELVSAALVEAESAPEPMPPAGAHSQPGTEGASDPGDDGHGAAMRRMHPGVAAAIKGTAGPGVREAVDAELAAFWESVSDEARERPDGEDTGLVVRAGLAAAPYLLRRADWDTASALLAQAAIRDESPGVTQALLPSLRRIAEATGAPVDAGRLAGVLMRVDPGAAERLLRGALKDASVAGGYWNASMIAGDLFNLLHDAGRLGEALEVARQKEELTRRARLGPWSRLGDEARRLQVLGRMGEHEKVLAEVGRLRGVMAGLPGRRGPDESVDSWNVRETTLNIGYLSALATGRWELCLELNAEITASVLGRGAGVHEVAGTRFNDSGPLMRLGRTVEAGRLLADCQRVFEDYADTAMLGMVLSARAGLEDELGNRRTAVNLERAALRLKYARPGPRAIAISHHNLANYLGRAGGDRAERRAHRLAAALIWQLAGMSHYLAQAIRALAAELGEDGADPSLPSTPAEVVAVAERTEGVRLGALLAALQPDPTALEAALAEIRTAASTPPG
jgi:hypothetical protein